MLKSVALAITALTVPTISATKFNFNDFFADKNRKKPASSYSRPHQHTSIFDHSYDDGGYQPNYYDYYSHAKKPTVY